MITMDQIHRIRDLFFRQGKNLAEIATIIGIDWRTVRKYVDKEDFNELICRIYEVSFDYILFENLHENLPLNHSFNPDFDEVLVDCSEKERQFLLLLMKSAKETARRELEY